MKKAKSILILLMVLALLTVPGLTALAAGPSVGGAPLCPKGGKNLIDLGKITGDTGDYLYTKDQLISVYKGEVKNWSELGGEDAPIVVIGREAGSGTRGAFEELLELEDACAYASELDSTGAVIAKVAATPGAIGYVSLDALDDTVKAFALDDVEATAENIKAGNYFLSRPFVMATKGEISEQSEAVQELFKYLVSDEGKQVISGVGLITVD